MKKNKYIPLCVLWAFGYGVQATSPDTTNVPQVPSEVGVQYETYLTFHEAGDVTNATLALEKVIQMGTPYATDTLYLHITLANLYHEMGDSKSARRMLQGLEEQVATDHALYPYLLYAIAEVIEQEEPSKAAETYQSIMRNYASTPPAQQAMLAYARNVGKDGDVQTASVYFEKYLNSYQGRKEQEELVPEYITLLLNGQFAEKAAEKTRAYWQGHRLYPDSGDMGLELARIWSETKPELYRALLTDVAQHKTETGQRASIYLGNDAIDQKDTENAQRFYEKAFKEYPLSDATLTAYRKLSPMVEQQGRAYPIDRWSTETRSLENDSLLDELTILYAKSLEDIGKDTQARTILEALKPAEENVRKKHAQALAIVYLNLAKNQPEQASDLIYRATLLTPFTSTSPRAFRKLLAQGNEEQWDEVVAHVKQAIAEDPGRYERRMAKTWLEHLLEHKAFSNAKIWSDELIQSQPKKNDIRFWLAEAWLDAGELITSLEVLDSHVPPPYLYARINIQTGQWERALKVLDPETLTNKEERHIGKELVNTASNIWIALKKQPEKFRLCMPYLNKTALLEWTEALWPYMHDPALIAELTGILGEDRLKKVEAEHALQKSLQYWKENQYEAAEHAVKSHSLNRDQRNRYDDAMQACLQRLNKQFEGLPLSQQQWVAEHVELDTAQVHPLAKNLIRQGQEAKVLSLLEPHVLSSNQVKDLTEILALHPPVSSETQAQRDALLRQLKYATLPLEQRQWLFTKQAIQDENLPELFNLLDQNSRMVRRFLKQALKNNQTNLIEEVTRKRPEFREKAWASLGRHYWKKGEPNQAKKYFQNLWEVFPDTHQGKKALSRLLEIAVANQAWEELSLLESAYIQTEAYQKQAFDFDQELLTLYAKGQQSNAWKTTFSRMWNRDKVGFENVKKQYNLLLAHREWLSLIANNTNVSNTALVPADVMLRAVIDYHPRTSSGSVSNALVHWKKILEMQPLTPWHILAYQNACSYSGLIPLPSYDPSQAKQEEWYAQLLEIRLRSLLENHQPHQVLAELAQWKPVYAKTLSNPIQQQRSRAYLQIAQSIHLTNTYEAVKYLIQVLEEPTISQTTLDAIKLGISWGAHRYDDQWTATIRKRAASGKPRSDEVVMLFIRDFLESIGPVSSLDLIRQAREAYLPAASGTLEFQELVYAYRAGAKTNLLDRIEQRLTTAPLSEREKEELHEQFTQWCFTLGHISTGIQLLQDISSEHTQETLVRRGIHAWVGEAEELPHAEAVLQGRTKFIPLREDLLHAYDRAVVQAGYEQDRKRLLFAYLEAVKNTLSPITETWFNRAINLVKDAGNLETAEALLARYLELYSDTARAEVQQRKMVDVKMAQRESEEAWQLIEKQLATYTDRHEAMDYAQKMLRRMRPYNSENIVKLGHYMLKNASNDRERYTANQHIGDHYLHSQQFDKARTYLSKSFRQATHLNPHQRARTGMKLLRAATGAYINDPNDPSLADSTDSTAEPNKVSLADIEAIKADIEDLIDGNPDPEQQGTTAYQYAKTLGELGMGEEAREIYADIVEQGGEKAPYAQYQLAQSLEQEGNTQSAIDAYLKYLEQFSEVEDERDQMYPNIVMANVLRLSESLDDVELTEELKGTAEQMLNGVSNPQAALDIAQYFGRQGYQDIENMMLTRFYDDAVQSIADEPDINKSHENLHHLTQRLFKMGYYEQAVQLGEKYEAQALNPTEGQVSSKLYDAQYERVRALRNLKQWRNAENILRKMIPVLNEQGLKETEGKFLFLLDKTTNDQKDRWRIKEELVKNHFSNPYSTYAKLHIGARHYNNGEYQEALELANALIHETSDPQNAKYDPQSHQDSMSFAAAVFEQVGEPEMAQQLRAQLQEEYPISIRFSDQYMKTQKEGE